MDPVTAFAAAQAAVAGIKACVNLYKDAKSVGKDVSSIAHEISGNLGKFFDAQEQVCRAGSEIENKIIKTKSVNQQALDNVLRVRQLQEFEQELKELLIYHTPMAGLWEDFQAERRRIREDIAEQERLEREKEVRAKKLKAKQQEEDEVFVLVFAIAAMGMAILAGIIYLIV
jgi:hypothetical protein